MTQFFLKVITPFFMFNLEELKVDFTTHIPKDVTCLVIDDLLRAREREKSLKDLDSLWHVNKTFRSLINEKYKLKPVADKLDLYSFAVITYLVDLKQLSWESLKRYEYLDSTKYPDLTAAFKQVYQYEVDRDPGELLLKEFFDKDCNNEKGINLSKVQRLFLRHALNTAVYELDHGPLKLASRAGCNIDLKDKIYIVPPHTRNPYSITILLKTEDFNKFCKPLVSYGIIYDDVTFLKLIFNYKDSHLIENIFKNITFKKYTGYAGTRTMYVEHMAEFLKMFTVVSKSDSASTSIENLSDSITLELNKELWRQKNRREHEENMRKHQLEKKRYFIY